MKTCSKCKLSKGLKEFYPQNDRKSGSSYCRSCFNEYCIKRWINKKKMAIEYLGGSCKRCGYNEHYAAMQFHHIDPKEKSFMWNKLRLKSEKKIKTELDKCELLCANCHAIHHSNSPVF
jgi:hypothetical protein